LQLTEEGEPLYGLRDEVDLEKIKALGLPFWLAGSRTEAEHLQQALEQGGAGIQVGTAFALCRESGLDDTLKQSLIQKVMDGSIEVFTDPVASPTGFPFKVVQLEGTLSEDASFYAERGRMCNLGYLRTVYAKEDGTLGYRCASESVEAYVNKGGTRAEAEGRKWAMRGVAPR
jgi:NAD(P)H-dependent flavin oxidoreductase YrpB (nitropropane dioxygenase family)